MTRATLGRWGNNLATRLPAQIVEVAGLHDGQRVDMSAQDDTVIIRRVEPDVTLEDIFRGKTPDAWRDEYAHAYDWSPDIGRELILK